MGRMGCNAGGDPGPGTTCLHGGLGLRGLPWRGAGSAVSPSSPSRTLWNPHCSSMRRPQYSQPQPVSPLFPPPQPGRHPLPRRLPRADGTCQCKQIISVCLGGGHRSGTHPGGLASLPAQPPLARQAQPQASPSQPSPLRPRRPEATEKMPVCASAAEIKTVCGL